MIRARRIEIGKRQEDLANDAEVSQKLISEIERGEQDLLSAGIGRVRNIARALKWSLNELQDATGLDLGVESTTVKDPPATKGKKTELPLPDALHEAVQLYGKRFPELRDARWQQYLAGFNWREGQPDDPEAWLDLYRDLTRAGIVPGSH